ncbi:MAG: penicillin acylase family protein [Bacteroidota bacterium]
MRWVKFSISLLLTILLMGVLLIPFGSQPFSLGAFFSPFQGFWHNATPVHESQPTQLDFPELTAPVEIVFDERQVPHVFAQNDQDLYFAQGYLVAKDRLWQMEFQTLAAAGRLSEVVGRGDNDVILNLDRQNRRKGLAFGAERSFTKVQADDLTMKALEAYTAGVNAYIESLSPADLPLEYKLLNYQPEPWEPFKAALLQKYMANTLAARADDIEHTHALRIWGKERFDILYPEFPKGDIPIIPDQDSWRPKRVGYRYLPVDPSIPAVPENYHPDSLLPGPSPRDLIQNDELNGSNNWAVSGQKSANGRPMLANDPHLGLSLPSIWYEMQLSSPSHNVYGVTLAGSPGITIGFNDSIAWGVTNAGQDVMDFFATEFRDDRRKEYRYDDQWLPIKERIETINIRGEAPYLDTVLYTHIGPVIFDKNYGNQPVPLSMRWMAHEPSNELLTFLQLNRARNYDDYVKALESYVCPAQNFVFASASGDIAIWQHGRYVKKWEGQGKFILDGSRKDHMWGDFLDQENSPHVRNPEQGYVASANQHPTSDLYPYYYTGGFEDFRGKRINQLLSSKDTFDVADMKAYQLDTYGVWAAEILDLMLGDLDTTVFSPTDRQAVQYLKDWDYHYDIEKIAPTMFQLWWQELNTAIWQDELAVAGVPLEYPDWSTTIRILQDSVAFSFYQKVGDTAKITRPFLVNRTFHKVLGQLQNEYPEMSNWTWGNWKQTKIRHVIPFLEPFARAGLPTDGFRHILNATGATHGPSWRMVVSLGPTIEAYGVYPGGQSGNPSTIL